MDGVLIACRFVHFCAAMLLFGSSAFVAVIVPQKLAGRHDGLMRWSSAFLALLLVATGLGWFGLQVGEAGNGWADVTNPAMWVALAGGTDFGAIWIWHVGIAIVLLAAVALPPKPRRSSLLVGSAALLASLGLIGHAAMQQGAVGIEHRINHMLHLLAAGFWFGALPPVLACLVGLRSPERRKDGMAALTRFSGLGHAAVAVTLLTGILNTGLTLGGLPLNLNSPYQALLAIKIGLVALMLAIALTNRYVLTQRLAVRGLVIGTSAELLLGVAVVALVSAFATYDPA